MNTPAPFAPLPPAIVELPSPSPDGLKRFIGHAAHDFKNPLGTLKAAVETLLLNPAGYDPEELREMLGILFDSTVRLNTILDDILVLHRLQEQSYFLEELDTSRILRSVIDRLPALIRDRGPDLRLPEEFPPVWGDALLVEQIWLNLLVHAFTLAPKHSRWEITGRVQADGSVHFRLLGPSESRRWREWPQVPPPSDWSEIRTRGQGLGAWVLPIVLTRLGGHWLAPGIDGAGMGFMLPGPNATGPSA